jgi:hypothetical protein
VTARPSHSDLNSTTAVTSRVWAFPRGSECLAMRYASLFRVFPGPVLGYQVERVSLISPHRRRARPPG